MSAWPRDHFAAAVWASPTLKPLERLVALAYADHAADRAEAWVSYPRLRERTGMSRDAVARAISGLVEAGWLVVAEAARQHRSTRYRLATPDLQQSATRTADLSQQSVSRTAAGAQSSVSRTAVLPSSPSPGPLTSSSSPSPELSSPSPELSSPGDGPDYSADYSEEASAMREALPPEQGAAVAALLARHGPALDEAVAVAAIQALAASGKAGSLIGYTARWTVEKCHRQAGAPVPTRGSTTCPGCGGAGWLGADAEDRPRPCPTCKPHLTPSRRHLQAVSQ